MANKFFILLIGFFLSQYIKAQELYFKTGKNYSRYYSAIVDNQNYLIKNSNLVGDYGNSYEIGILFNQGDTAVDFALGLTYNEYNTTYAIANTATKYTWKTKYIGIAPQLNFRLYQSNNKNWCYCDELQIYAKLGINTAAFVYGYENANGINYSLTSHPDYKNIILQPFAGVDLQYPLSDMSTLHLGYSYSIATIARDQGNSFNFMNDNIYMGINIKLN